MNDEITTANAEAVSESVENQTASEFARGRSKKLKETSPKESAKDITEETEAKAEVAEEKSEDNVLSKFNLDEMSEEEKSSIRAQLIPGAEKRIGELTAKRKAAEEQLVAMQREQSQLKLKQPEVKNNPFSEIATLDILQEKANEVVEVISWAEDLLFESDSYNADDEVTQVEGKPMTKKEVRKALLNARKSRDFYIPDQLKKLQLNQDDVLIRQQLGRKAIEELEWLQDKNGNELKTQFLNLMSDGKLQMDSRMPYLVAHAINSLSNRNIIKDTPVAKSAAGNIKLDPPKMATSSSAASEKTERPQSKAIKESQSRFLKTGKLGDFVKYRTSQHR
jgi:hypothetical protein